ncbi:ComEC/Rec2 family competence protein [Ochrobactrum sp. CM-21-5]|nr:ComEC/Rec2 family competence protein [Ochrobactrum sp. CM-21-5]MBC2885086.1 ComEC/Rec2 family competence protein [Ochrobactrum sp. CM-21-5]
MTGINDMREADERALVKSLPDGLMRSLLPEAWPSYEEDTRPALLPEAVTAVPLRERLFLGLSAMSGVISDQMGREIGRGLFFLLLPVLAGSGAIVYFTLPFEPDWLPLLSILIFLVIGRVTARRSFLLAQTVTLVIALQMGVIGSKIETERRATPMLGSDVATRVTGRVVALEHQHNGSWRVTLDVLQTEKPRLRHSPQRIRINARDIPAATVIGSGLNGFVRLRTPSGPVRPGNYDFSLHAYFNGIGANGFFLGTPKLVAVEPPRGLVAGIMEWIAMLRVHVAERINEAVGGEDGSVAAALIAGQRAGISEETNENLRRAGLAHILSISGLHMALAAGVVMLSLRSIFALFPAFSSRYPVKKYAALLSLLSCTFYLAMSGADVAAQRSYVMIAVMLCALLADRAAISMRNLAIAALAMIAISPHEILGPSFQMSFSATAALIAAFSWWTEQKSAQRLGMERPVKVSGQRMLRFFAPVAATACTSLVAGLASGIFAAYHFNNTAPLGMIGNVLALPVISMLVMPFAVLSLVLMPFQLDWLPLQVMGAGISIVRYIAGFVAEFSPDGNPGVIPPTALLFWAGALVLAVVLTTWLKLLAVPLLAAGFIVFLQNPLPDIVISEDARLVGVRLESGDFVLNRNRPSRFTTENWKTAYLIENFIEPLNINSKTRGIDADGFVCEENLCTTPLRDGHMLAYTADETMHEVACNIGDVVILAIPGEALDCGRENVLVLTRRDLALKGTLEIRLGDTIEMASSAEADTSGKADASAASSSSSLSRQHTGQLTYAVGVPTRPWHLHRLYSRAARGLPERVYKKKLASTKQISGCGNQKKSECR